MTNQIVFILSDARSGSTLIDQLLGANDDVVTVGEVHWLAAYVRQDRSIYNPAHPLVCSCGNLVPECEFWRNVADAVERPLDTLRLRPRFFDAKKSGHADRKLVDRAKGRLKSLIQEHPACYRNTVCQKIYDGPRVATDCIQLYDAIVKVTGARCIVDSSKTAFRFWSVYRQIPQRARVILLARDYRAVVHSKMNRGKTLESATRGWKQKILQMEELTKGIERGAVLRLKYELLCEDPRKQIERLCEFLDLKFSDEMLVRPAEGIHHLGGSPSKFDASKSAIKLDKSYLGVFSQIELQRMEKIVGESARIWGYH